MNARSRVLSFAFLVALLTGCPLGRGNKELGEDCTSANQCPMGTTGLRCSGECKSPPCAEKYYCTKSCTADTDCVSKFGPMTCRAGSCAK